MCGRGKMDPGHDIVFYDGGCGLCHRSVKFIVKHDRRGVFRFAPLDSATFRDAYTEVERARLPDSVIVRTTDGRTLTHSAGTIYVLKRLGGFWSVLGSVGRVVPRIARDAVYNGIARVRHRLFKRPKTACPMVPEELRGRFL